jgi:hypothetical protein
MSALHCALVQNEKEPMIIAGWGECGQAHVLQIWTASGLGLISSTAEQYKLPFPNNTASGPRIFFNDTVQHANFYRYFITLQNAKKSQYIEYLIL